MTDKLTSGGRNVDFVLQKLDHEDEEGALEEACSQVDVIIIVIIFFFIIVTIFFLITVIIFFFIVDTKMTKYFPKA